MSEYPDLGHRRPSALGLTRRPAHRDKSMNGAQPLKAHGDSSGLMSGLPAVLTESLAEELSEHCAKLASQIDDALVDDVIVPTKIEGGSLNVTGNQNDRLR